MEEKRVTRKALEPQFTGGWLDEETHSKSLQDEHQMRQEYRHALQEYAQNLRHHHLQTHNLCHALLNHTIADRNQALQDYHQAVQEHDDMTQSYQQRVLDYWRMVREHRRRAFPFQHP